MSSKQNRALSKHPDVFTSVSAKVGEGSKSETHKKAKNKKLALRRPLSLTIKAGWQVLCDDNLVTGLMLAVTSYGGIVKPFVYVTGKSICFHKTCHPGFSQFIAVCVEK